jgi:antitoxin component YwqK of YwqJK toxin-antitoxin module
VKSFVVKKIENQEIIWRKWHERGRRRSNGQSKNFVYSNSMKIWHENARL